ncbi:class F sortase [Streptomyces aidingensis]|uniref:Sortase family protein n=1 Tax=Streptomyces aidingensis TaxID=910347 RepID=A0A1I1TIL6_9ACTN|nr:class F sortase [Streptomyces aidingensis]SFD55330.1 Sortase family protein [Streptomyces aidingensis]
MRTADKTANALLAGALATALATTVWLLTGPGGHPDPPQPSAEQGFPAGPGGEGDPGRIDARAEIPAGATAVTGSLPPSTPIGVRIPAIDVDAPTVGYGLGPDGSLEIPPEDKSHLAGWYHGGVTPGSEGTALIAGHVDDADGPAVFYDLGALRRGDLVEVARADGRTALFLVDAVEVFGREMFPDELVYGHTGRPELRLITCGGGFSHSQGYLGNVVVFAHLIGQA